jgi:hypothetical protein
MTCWRSSRPFARHAHEQNKRARAAVLADIETLLRDHVSSSHGSVQ